MSDEPGPPNLNQDDDLAGDPLADFAHADLPALTYAGHPPLARAVEDKRYPRIDMSRGSAAVDLFVVVALLIATIETLHLLNFAEWMQEHAPIFGMFWTNVLIGAVTLTIVAVMLRARRQKASALGLAKTSFGKTIGLAAATIPVCYVSVLVTVSAYLALSGTSIDGLVQERAAFLDEVPHIPPLIAVPFALFVGIHEEVLFRGFILGRLRALFGSTVAAVIASSIVFGLLHGYQGAIGVVQTTTVGLVLATLAARFRTIWPAILAHGLFDTITLVLLPLLGDSLQELANQVTTTQAAN